MISFKFHQRNNIATPIPEIVEPDAFAGPHHLYINGAIIKKVAEFNFLGIIINENMKWEGHTAHLSTKIGRNVGMLSRLKYIIPFHILKMLYFTLVHSSLSYGTLAWGFSVGGLAVLQKKAIRAITHAKYNSHTEHTFKTLKILKIEDIFFTEVPQVLLQPQKRFCAPLLQIHI